MDLYIYFVLTKTLLKVSLNFFKAAQRKHKYRATLRQ